MNAVSKEVSIREIMNRSWDVTKDNMALLAGLTLVWWLGMGAMSFLPVVGWMVTAPLTAGYYKSLMKIRAKGTVEFTDIFWGFLDFNRFIHLVLLSFLVTIIVCVASLLFIIPGIYYGVATFFATQAFVLYGDDSVGAIRKSIAMVKGRWWWTAEFLFMIALLNFLGFICVVIGLFISTPMTQLMTLEFAERFAQPEKEAEPAVSPSVFPVNPG